MWELFIFISVLEPIEKTSSDQPELDWKKQAEKRRQRLASKSRVPSLLR